jgi:ZIP family zinc transporter/zinc and cadmium transporter
MEQNFWIPFGASLLAALVTAIGIQTIRRFEAWGRRNSVYFVCFAAGVLISVSFLHIIPKAFEMSRAAPAWLLGGFVLLHLFNRFITAFVCERDPDSKLGIGLVALLGIGFHSVIDGIIYSITFSVSTFTGTLAAVGMVLHEFPEGIITYLLLIRGGFSARRALLLSLVAASVSTPLGTLLSYPLISEIGRPLLGTLLALSAGALVYVGATHLLPQAEKEPRKFSLLAMGGGILVAVLIVMSK